MLTSEGYEINFGSEEKNEAFRETIQHSYDGHEHGTSLYHLAVCCEELGQLEEAKTFYKQALEYEPSNYHFLGGYASFLYLHGNPETALEAYLQILKYERKNGRTEDAIRTFQVLSNLGKRLGLDDDRLQKLIEAS